MIGEMHSFFTSKTMMSKKFKRYNYDQTILPMIAEKIEKAASLSILKPEQAKIILSALNEMKQRFEELDNMQEKHIIHADLGKPNIIVNKNGQLTPIDFSLCGYGHFYMDINMFNGDLKFSHHIIEGYKSVRDCEINAHYMEPYVALGFVLFISCQYERAKDWDWFPNIIDSMCRDAFKPLADKTDFVTL
jgi:Ser/Thr protein kinase RdoA (MazF antagonist)